MAALQLLVWLIPLIGLALMLYWAARSGGTVLWQRTIGPHERGTLADGISSAGHLLHRQPPPPPAVPSPPVATPTATPTPTSSP